MATVYYRNVSNPLLLLEIVAMVIDNVHMVPDLLSCACVNETWSVAALKKLYKGSLHDMQFRTPDIGSLNCLFVASRERFRRNMGFVKHLLLSPETPSIDEAAYPDTRAYCIEKCRAMRHRQSAELLLRPQGRGLASLTIPFEIKGQDWSFIADLLLPRTIRFLAIDDYYCGLLTARFKHSQELINPNDTFINLKALTIYISSNFPDIDNLCQLLKSCDLEFFHLEEPNGANSLTQFATTKLLSSLREQKNLRALALIIPHCALLSTISRDEGQGCPWPGLKMLSLGFGDRNWPEQFPKFEKLQILCLRNFAPQMPTINQNSIQDITKFRDLRVINIAFIELDDTKALLDIARGCPLLQRFSANNLGYRRETELAENLCIGLLRALPRLEYFELDLRFRIAGESLQDLARHCSQLTVLALPRARLSLSLTVLKEAYPFLNLEAMYFSEIFFEDPRRSLQGGKVWDIAVDWRRMFPKLRGVPCPADDYSSYRQQVYLKEELEGDSVSGDEEMSLSEPGLDFDDYDSDWFILRSKLWKVLGYPFVQDRLQNMWQKNLEIEITGWPVVPLMAFSDPDLHSTTAKLCH